MSDFSPNDVFRLPGQLFLNVANLTASPYGGVAVGYFERGEMIVDEESEAILSEATGKQTGVLTCEALLGFEFDLVQFDVDVLKKPWAYVSRTLREPAAGATREPGLQSASQPCLFATDDPEHPCLLIYAPVFRLGRKRIPYGSMDEKRREHIILDLIDSDNGAGKVFACDLLRNLSLT